MSKELATIITEAPIKVHVDDMEYTGYEPRRFDSNFENLDLNPF